MSYFNDQRVAEAAEAAAWAIFANGSATVLIEPGDSTRYVVMLGKTGGASSEWWFGSNFGVVAPWAGTFALQPDYVTARYVENGNEHTGAVLACFMNHLSTLLALGPASLLLMDKQRQSL